MKQLMLSASGFALAAAASLLTTSAMSADLGGNCCADLEERVAELEATTVRKGNRKVSLQIYGQVSEAIIWWNDGAESNVYVQEMMGAQNRLGFTGTAKINSDWSAGFRLELQIRAYRSNFANQLSLGASNNTQIAVYNTQSVAIRHAHWFLRSERYGTVSVGRDLQAVTGTQSISLVNPDGFSGPILGPGMANAGYFLRRSGTTGNAGLSGLTWQNFAYIRNGDGPTPMDYFFTSSGVKYSSPWFLGQTKTSGFNFQADWGMDDVWSVALRYAEDFGAFRVAGGVGYSNWSGPDRGMCSTGASGNTPGAPPPGTTPGTDLGSSIRCDALQASGSLLHVPTGLYVSGGWGQMSDKNANAALLARTASFQSGAKGENSFWWLQGGWQAKLNTLGNTIFWGQYMEFSTGLGVVNNLVQTVAANDVVNSLGTAAVIRNTDTQVWGGGISQNIDAAAMTLYAGFHNYTTSGTIGAIASSARARTNPIDDMQLFYTGATIRF